MASRGGKRPGAGRKPGMDSPLKKSLADEAKQHAPAALRALAQISADDKAPAAARVSASIAILDRGYGKPPQSLELSGKDGAPMEMKYTPDDARREIASKLAGLAAGGGAAELPPEPESGSA